MRVFELRLQPSNQKSSKLLRESIGAHYRPCLIALPGRHLVFQSKVQPLFEDFTDVIFHTKIRKHKRKIAKFFWGDSSPRPPINLFQFRSQGHYHICLLFLGIN